MTLARVVLGSSLLVAWGYLIGAASASQAPSAVSPAKAGWSTAALNELAAYVQSQKTTGFLIVQDRKVIYERNWPLPSEAAAFARNFTHGRDADGALQEDVASLQKSFIAILAGIAIDKGLLNISNPVSAYMGRGWSKAAPSQEKLIAVRNLLEMNSGLTELLAYEAPAGTKFFYNTPAYAILKPVLEKASGQKLDGLTRRWLTEPAGMTDTLWRQRPFFGGVGNPTGLYTTPRDMAKLGQLLLDEGKAADGKRVISTAQLAALFQRSPTNPAYGRLWWLNGSTNTLRASGARTEGEALIPAAPPDLVAAFGALDRRLYIVRSRKLIVVRTGQAAPDRGFDQQVWLRLMKAAPEG